MSSTEHLDRNLKNHVNASLQQIQKGVSNLNDFIRLIDKYHQEREPLSELSKQFEDTLKKLEEETNKL